MATPSLQDSHLSLEALAACGSEVWVTLLRHGIPSVLSEGVKCTLVSMSLWPHTFSSCEKRGGLWKVGPGFDKAQAPRQGLMELSSVCGSYNLNSI